MNPGFFRGGNQPLSPKAEKGGYSFLQFQASGSPSLLSCHSLHPVSRALPPLFTPTSVFQLVWFGLAFCFVLPGECHTFPRVFVLPNSSPSSIIVSHFTFLANSIPS